MKHAGKPRQAMGAGLRAENQRKPDMITFNYGWMPYTPPRPRAQAIQQRKAKSIFNKVRPSVFKPGPYKDQHGNLRFLGRDK